MAATITPFISRTTADLNRESLARINASSPPSSAGPTPESFRPAATPTPVATKTVTKTATKTKVAAKPTPRDRFKEPHTKFDPSKVPSKTAATKKVATVSPQTGQKYLTSKRSGAPLRESDASKAASARLSDKMTKGLGTALTIAGAIPVIGGAARLAKGAMAARAIGRAAKGVGAARAAAPAAAAATAAAPVVKKAASTVATSVKPAAAAAPVAKKVTSTVLTATPKAGGSISRSKLLSSTAAPRPVAARPAQTVAIRSATRTPAATTTTRSKLLSSTAAPRPVAARPAQTVAIRSATRTPAATTTTRSKLLSSTAAPRPVAARSTTPSRVGNEPAVRTMERGRNTERMPTSGENRRILQSNTTARATKKNPALAAASKAELAATKGGTRAGAVTVKGFKAVKETATARGLPVARKTVAAEVSKRIAKPVSSKARLRSSTSPTALATRRPERTALEKVADRLRAKS